MEANHTPCAQCGHRFEDHWLDNENWSLKPLDGHGCMVKNNKGFIYCKCMCYDSLELMVEKMRNENRRLE
jgi:hypothetical protein